MLQEGFASAVGCEQWRRHNSTERSHGQDETALSLYHAWCDYLRDTKGAKAVDCDDVLHLLLLCLDERHWDAMTLSHIVDQNRYVQLSNQCLQVLEVGVFARGEVHRVELGLDFAFLLDLGGKGFEFRLRSRDKEDVEAFACELEGIFFANAIGSTGHDCPCAFLAELGELTEVSTSICQ